jgi:hypothetical protein
MKKILATVLSLACVLGLVGCMNGRTVSIDFPFDVEDVVNIEMFHYAGDPVSAEKKVIVAKEDIAALYEKFGGLSLEKKDIEETTGAEITSFRFNLSDGTNYELVYSGYGVKKGTLKSATGNFEYFTSADIGWNWRWLNEDLEATAADESELPKYPNGSIPLSDPVSQPTVITNNGQ